MASGERVTHEDHLEAKVIMPQTAEGNSGGQRKEEEDERVIS